MGPQNLKTRIFLDGGNADETKEIIKLLGFLDCQTTNPTLISKNPGARKRLEGGEKFSIAEIFDFYRGGEFDLSNRWEDLDIRHELTEKGMERFSADWNALIKSEKRKIA